MAVQAQYTFSHDFRCWPPSDVNNLLDAPMTSDLTCSAAPMVLLSQQNLAIPQTRLYGSAGTSTSGRPAQPADGIVSHLYHQCVEIDGLVRVHSERMRSELEAKRKRQCRDLVSVVEQQVSKRLREKDVEIERVSRRNMELEEKVRQIAAESQIWFIVAKNNEALVYNLRSTLEQVLLQKAVAPGTAEEGYGDSDGAAIPAGDAQSCCLEEEDRRGGIGNVEVRRWACRACGEREVCVLILPCKHLCLCKECESRVDTCPVCCCAKNACLRISLS